MWRGGHGHGPGLAEGAGAGAKRLMVPLRRLAGVAGLAAMLMVPVGAGAGDLARGTPCLACHGPASVPAGPGGGQPVAPLLGGQPVAYLTTQMYLFREHLRQPAWMGELLQGWSDDDLQAVAEWLHGLPAPQPAALTAAQRQDEPVHQTRLQQLAAAHRCTFCHGDQWRGQENVPALAGQREEYLLASLRAYRDNSRSGYDASMAEVVQALSDADLIELAYGIARLGAH